eukprot:TRINITY_DN11995_c0_g1_i2.p1 TRINITY_DN11995_c0_g1~~TRINITY_DN11995_c0_g1_i2.p1  ORF type:complete len:290 (+),score=71.67 TRINITY_DN11995_c0_g1_i2:189-1058(+)
MAEGVFRERVMDFKKKDDRVVIIQAGIFMEDKQISSSTANEESINTSPLEVHVGYVPRNNPHAKWTDEVVIGVTYKHGKNQEVFVDVPSDRIKDFHLSYFMKMYTLPRSRNETFVTENRFINLDRFDGRFVQIPVTNFAPHPWRDDQYQIQIHNLKGPKAHFEEKVSFGGKITVVYYGFTSKSSADYLNDRELPWSNFEEEYKLEGTVQVYHVLQVPQFNSNHYHNDSPNNTNHHACSRGLSVMSDVWVRVPRGKNVLWRIGYDRFDERNGRIICGGHFESETLYLQPT